MSSPSIGVTKVELTPLDDVVGDPVALLLGEQDLAREPALVGPVLEHLLEQARGAQGVLPRLVEEVEEDAVLGTSEGSGTGREATSPRGSRRPAEPASPSHSRGGLRALGPGARSSSAGISAIRSGASPSRVLVPARTVTGRSVLSRRVKQGTPR